MAAGPQGDPTTDRQDTHKHDVPESIFNALGQFTHLIRSATNPHPSNAARAWWGTSPVGRPARDANACTEDLQPRQQACPAWTAGSALSSAVAPMEIPKSLNISSRRGRDPGLSAKRRRGSEVARSKRLLAIRTSRGDKRPGKHDASSRRVQRRISPPHHNHQHPREPISGEHDISHRVGGGEALVVPQHWQWSTAADGG